MQEHLITSWGDFLALVESPRLRGWAFRGQRKASWPIHSTLSRYLARHVEPARWAEQESRAIRVFRRKAHYFLDDPSALDDGFRCLALMQHHGSPTRLIDFSKSAYVAAYFALENATGEAAVFALNTPALWSNCSPCEHPGLNREATDPREPDHFERYFLSNRYPLVWPGEPWHMDRRLVAQAGTFVLPGRIGESIEELLAQYVRSDDMLLRITLPPSMRAEAMASLYRMNISHATLFPDLDGLARSMAYELEVNWISSSGPPR